MPTAAYARFSSSAQREASIADQVRNIRSYCERMGQTAPELFTDEAISGARNDRPGYLAMLNSARRGEFDVLLVDDLSRLSRDELECGRTLRELHFAGIRVVGVSDGVDTGRKGHKLETGMRRLMGELYLEGLAEATHRGLTGQALKGFSAGGLPYGYRVVPGDDGNKRTVDPTQAEVVRAIYAAYLDGKPPRQIAADLNRQGIPSPRGGTWTLSNIYPDKRGIGVLGNPVYSGKVIWNRSKWRKDPATGRRLRQERPPSEWIVTYQPDLAIVTPAVWEAAEQRARKIRARTRQAQDRHGPHARAGGGPRYLFSGLMVCGECGGSMVVVDYYRYGCATHKDRGTCGNSLKVPRAVVEEKLLATVKQELMTEAAYRVMEREVRAALKAQQAEPVEARKRLAEIQRERDNIMAAIRQGIITPSTKAALESAEADLKQAQAELTLVQQTSPSQILPRLREIWRSSVAKLEDIEDVPAAREALRQILGEIRIVQDKCCLTAEMKISTLGAMGQIGLVACPRYQSFLKNPAKAGFLF